MNARHDLPDAHQPVFMEVTVTLKRTPHEPSSMVTVGFRGGLGIQMTDGGPPSSGSKGKFRSLQVSSRDPSTRCGVVVLIAQSTFRSVTNCLTHAVC